MKINVSVDLTDLEADLYGTVDEYISDIIKADIQRQLKKSPEYKAWIKRKTEEAIDGIQKERT